MKLKLVLVLTIVLGINHLSAGELPGSKLIGSSDYRTGIGLRGGFASGITVKHFFADHAAFEIIASPAFKRGTWITGLYEYHVQAFGVAGLNWYYGGGGHLGFLGHSSAVGIDGILGLEYKIFEVPFTLGLDIKPMLNINYSPAFIMDGAFSLRFVF